MFSHQSHFRPKETEESFLQCLSRVLQGLPSLLHLSHYLWLTFHSRILAFHLLAWNQDSDISWHPRSTLSLTKHKLLFASSLWLSLSSFYSGPNSQGLRLDQEEKVDKTPKASELVGAAAATNLTTMKRLGHFIIVALHTRFPPALFLLPEQLLTNTNKRAVARRCIDPDILKPPSKFPDGGGESGLYYQYLKF